MRDKIQSLALMFSLALPLAVIGQGTFQNLSFEAVRNIPAFDPQGHPWLMSASDALPGWTCYIGTNQTSLAAYDELALDSAWVGVISTNAPYRPSGLIQGRYCASLQFGVVIYPTWTYQSASIAQTGQVPGGIQSIMFRGSDVFSVSFGGNQIQLVVWATQPNYKIYAGDMSQFAGQSGELRFTSYLHFNFIDSITFSSLRIPEPSVCCLFVFGALLFVRRALR